MMMLTMRLQIADCRLPILKSEINLKSEVYNLQFQDCLQDC
jgi:hypothetical protein